MTALYYSSKSSHIVIGLKTAPVGFTTYLTQEAKKKCRKNINRSRRLGTFPSGTYREKWQWFAILRKFHEEAGFSNRLWIPSNIWHFDVLSFFYTVVWRFCFLQMVFITRFIFIVSGPGMTSLRDSEFVSPFFPLQHYTHAHTHTHTALILLYKTLIRSFPEFGCIVLLRS